MIYGDITSLKWFDDDVTPYQFDKDLKNMGNVNNINVRINSYGGDVFAGQAIYTSLKRHTANITVYIDGIAASAASLIAMAGDVIRMPRNGMLMIHNPWTSVWGDSGKLRKAADVLDEISKAVIEAYKAKTKLNDAEIKDIMQAESWLGAEEALNKGFIDEIEDFEVSMAIDVKAGIVNINGLKMGLDRFPKAQQHKTIKWI